MHTGHNLFIYLSSTKLQNWNFAVSFSWFFSIHCFLAISITGNCQNLFISLPENQSDKGQVSIGRCWTLLTPQPKKWEHFWTLMNSVIFSFVCVMLREGGRGIFLYWLTLVWTYLSVFAIYLLNDLSEIVKHNFYASCKVTRVPVCLIFETSGKIVMSWFRAGIDSSVTFF